MTTPNNEWIEEKAGEFMRKMWHANDCPAHSNNMRPESECSCTLQAADEYITQLLTSAHKQGYLEGVETVEEIRRLLHNGEMESAYKLACKTVAALTNQER